MSLHKAKTLFCIAAMAIAVLLVAAGGTVYWLASIIVLGSALPGWRFVTRSATNEGVEQGADKALEIIEHRLNL